MKISIFGLGYVGVVTADGLARRGHMIVGVDVHAQKVDDFGRGLPPIMEPGLGDLLQRAQAGIAEWDDGQFGGGRGYRSIDCLCGHPFDGVGGLGFGSCAAGDEGAGFGFAETAQSACGDFAQHNPAWKHGPVGGGISARARGPRPGGSRA